MKYEQLSLFGDETVIPIPECSPIALEKFGTPERVAKLTVEAARRWKQQHPGQNVMDIIPPTWRAYIKANL